MNQARTPLWIRLGVVLTFIGFGVCTVLYMLVNTGVDIPLIGRVGDYRIAFNAKNVDNLEQAGSVEQAGVITGQVVSRTVEGDHAHVVISLDPKYAPMHEGVTVRIGAKSLVEETYIDLTDGHGPELPSNASLPDSAVQPITQLDDVINSLGPQARSDMGVLVRSAGVSTAGTQKEVSEMLAGLGGLGGEGHTALDAIAAQSNDLKSVVKDTTTVLNALDTGEGEIARLTTNADQLSKASADQRSAIEATFRRLPGMLDSARTASDKLYELSGSLEPVSARLDQAAPDLSRGLRNLPAATNDLQRLMPPLSGVLDRAPDTLSRVPTLGADLRDHLIPRARDILQDANPMMTYLRPYGIDLGAYVALNGAAWGYHDEVGRYYFRVMQIYNDSAASSPVDYGSTLGTYKNPVPKPGAAGRPGPFAGDYPRLGREPR